MGNCFGSECRNECAFILVFLTREGNVMQSCERSELRFRPIVTFCTPKLSAKWRLSSSLVLVLSKLCISRTIAQILTKSVDFYVVFDLKVAFVKINSTKNMKN